MKKQTATKTAEITSSTVREDNAVMLKLPEPITVGLINPETKEGFTKDATSVGFALVEIRGGRIGELSGAQDDSLVLNAFLYSDQDDLPVATYGLNLEVIQTDLGEFVLNPKKEVQYVLVQGLNPFAQTIGNIQRLKAETLYPLVEEQRQALEVAGKLHDAKGQSRNIDNYVICKDMIGIPRILLNITKTDEDVAALAVTALKHKEVKHRQNHSASSTTDIPQGKKMEVEGGDPFADDETTTTNVGETATAEATTEATA